MADEKYETEIKEPEDGLFVGVVYFWQTGFTAPQEVGHTKPKGMYPDVEEEAKAIARRHRAERRGENRRVVLNLDD